jgi:iron(III) transport system substrate-binding protein
LTVSSRTRLLLAVAGALSSSLVLAACGSSAGDPTTSAGGGKSGRTLTLYSGQHEEMTKAVVAAFEKQTGAKVRVRFGEEPELANQIAEEGSASPADVFFTENAPPLTELSDKGLLAPVDASALRQVPAGDNAANGRWLGVAARETALIYNPRLLPAAQLPRSILDLSQPQWKGKLAIAPGEVDFVPVVEAVDKLKGEGVAQSWLKGFAANAARYDDNEGIVDAVERGKVAAGIINHYYWYRAADEIGQRDMRSRLYYFGHQDPGALVDVSGAAALKSSKNPQLAQRFLSFLVSQSGQQAMVDSGDWEYPLAKGVEPLAGLKPFDSLQPPRISAAQLGDDHDALSLLQQAGLL